MGVIVDRVGRRRRAPARRGSPSARSRRSGLRGGSRLAISTRVARARCRGRRSARARLAVWRAKRSQVGRLPGAVAERPQQGAVGPGAGAGEHHRGQVRPCPDTPPPARSFDATCHSTLRSQGKTSASGPAPHVHETARACPDALTPGAAPETASPDAGTLPTWDLSDLYPAPDSPARRGRPRRRRRRRARLRGRATRAGWRRCPAPSSRPRSRNTSASTRSWAGSCPMPQLLFSGECDRCRRSAASTSRSASG